MIGIQGEIEFNTCNSLLGPLTTPHIRPRDEKKIHCLEVRRFL